MSDSGENQQPVHWAASAPFSSRQASGLWLLQCISCFKTKSREIITQDPCFPSKPTNLFSPFSPWFLCVYLAGLQLAQAGLEPRDHLLLLPKLSSPFLSSLALAVERPVSPLEGIPRPPQKLLYCLVPSPPVLSFHTSALSLDSCPPMLCRLISHTSLCWVPQ